MESKVLQFPERPERRRAENRLRRATQDAEEFEDRQIDYWLALADVALDNSWERLKERNRKTS
jgi:hypothetical protein